MKKTLLTGGSVVTGDGLLKQDILIDITGKIAEIKPSITDHRDTEVLDVSHKILLPLLIDCHVHFREPGLEHKATMQTEAASALAGGIGCVCEMPNTIPPTVTIAALADKVRRAEYIDGCTLKFYFGVTEAIHLQALCDLWSGTSLELRRLKHHCAGVKLYFDHSTGNQKIDQSIIAEVFERCAALSIPIIAHCEDPTMNEAAALQCLSLPQNVALHSRMRPPESEAKSITDAIALVEKTGAALHIAHLSTSQGVQLVRSAKAQNLPVTCEVTPHHLFLTEDDYATLGSLAKMNPPLRSSIHQKALWEGVADGTVDCISTDHAPHTLEEKRSGEPLKSPSGVPGVQTMLPLLLSVALGHWPHPQAKLKPPPFAVQDILRLCFDNPNRIFSLMQPPIEQGARARIVILNPAVETVLHARNLHSKCGWTPYEGWKLQGGIERIILD